MKEDTREGERGRSVGRELRKLENKNKGTCYSRKNIIKRILGMRTKGGRRRKQ